jgi:hypothetical protein
MTHQNENSQNNSAVQHILDNGIEGLGEAIRLVIDQAMKIERSQVLQANRTSAPTSAWAMPMVSKARPSPPASARFAWRCRKSGAQWTSIPVP